MTSVLKIESMIWADREGKGNGRKEKAYFRREENKKRKKGVDNP